MVESTLLKIACAGGTLTITADHVRLELSDTVEVPRRDVLGVRAVRRPGNADLLIVAGRGERILLAEGVSFVDALRALDALGTLPDPIAVEGSQPSRRGAGALVRAGDIRLLISPEVVRAEGARAWSFPRSMIRGVTPSLAAEWADVRLRLTDGRAILAPQVRFESALRMIELLGYVGPDTHETTASLPEGTTLALAPTSQSHEASGATPVVADVSAAPDEPDEDVPDDEWVWEGWQEDRTLVQHAAMAVLQDEVVSTASDMETAQALPAVYEETEQAGSAARPEAEQTEPRVDELTLPPGAGGGEQPLASPPGSPSPLPSEEDAPNVQMSMPVLPGEPVLEASPPKTSTVPPRSTEPAPEADVSSAATASDATETTSVDHVDGGPAAVEPHEPDPVSIEPVPIEPVPIEPALVVPSVRIVPVVSQPGSDTRRGSPRLVPVLSAGDEDDVDRTPTAPRLAIVKAPRPSSGVARSRTTDVWRSSPALIVAACLLVLFGLIAFSGYVLTSQRSPSTQTRLQSQSTSPATRASATSAASPAQAAAIVPLYVEARNGILYALNAHTGTLLWSSSANAHITTAATISQGTLYVGAQDADVYALRASDRRQLWQFPTHGAIDGAPAVANGIVYASSHDNSLYAVRASDGKPLWRYTATGWFAGPPAVVDGTVYACSYNSRVYAFNAATGSLLWSHVASGALMSTPTVAGGVVYAGSSDNSLVALNASTGQLIWQYATGGSLVAPPAVGAGVVSVGSMDGAVYVLDASTGALRWKYQTPDSILGAPAIAGGTVFVGSTDGYFYALDSSTGALRWRYKTGSAIASWPAVSRGVVYTGSTDHSLYALDEQSGALLWRFTTGGIVNSLPAIGG